MYLPLNFIPVVGTVIFVLIQGRNRGNSVHDRVSSSVWIEGFSNQRPVLPTQEVAQLWTTSMVEREYGPVYCVCLLFLNPVFNSSNLVKTMISLYRLSTVRRSFWRYSPQSSARKWVYCSVIHQLVTSALINTCSYQDFPHVCGHCTDSGNRFGTVATLLELVPFASIFFTFTNTGKNPKDWLNHFVHH